MATKRSLDDRLRQAHRNSMLVGAILAVVLALYVVGNVYLGEYGKVASATIVQGSADDLWEVTYTDANGEDNLATINWAPPGSRPTDEIRLLHSERFPFLNPRAQDEPMTEPLSALLLLAIPGGIASGLWLWRRSLSATSRAKR